MYLECSVCKRRYPIRYDYFRCPICRSTLVVRYEDIEYREGLFLNGSKGVWRYRLIPVGYKYAISLGEGSTYLQKADRLAREIGVSCELYLKNEAMNPTGSFIDRGVSVAISYAYYNGFKKVSTLSPGNLGASIAAYASKAGMESRIFIPSNIESGKLYQILMYGGNVYMVQNIESELDRVLSSINEGYYPILPNNPLYLEGVKTIAYEIAEDLNWRSPDAVVTPMGSGGLIYSIWKGFNELYKLGYIDRLPKMIGVQIKGITPIVDRILGSDDYEETTHVPELSQKIPLNMILAVNAIKDSGGYAYRVEYRDAIKSLLKVARYEGILIEIAAAATLAVLDELEEMGFNSIVCILTGAGLKDPNTARELTKEVRRKLGVIEEGYIRVGRTKFKILEAIDKGYNYGYSIWKYLLKQGVEIKLPTIYQHLNELEKMGYIQVVSKTGLTRQTTLYTLTSKGKRILKLI